MIRRSGAAGREVAVATLDARQIEELLTAAREAAASAYVPYSRFPVGAAVLTADGTVVTGCNVENASYGLTVCGERVATWTAAAAGHRTIRAVAVATPAAPGATPCGACRQVLNEFAPVDGELVVLLDGADGPEQLVLSELLPRSFGPRDLGTSTRQPDDGPARK
jgi:cytidine deaminase